MQKGLMLGLRSLALVLLVAGVVVLAAGGRVAAAGEAPVVSAQGNAPGWITVNYWHSGFETVGYEIQREGTGVIGAMSSPEGQFLDHHLQPLTTHRYRVCAVFEDDEPACSEWVTATSLPAPGRPANFDPPAIVDVDLAQDAIRIHWGPTGDYTRILIRWNEVGLGAQQPEVPNTPNGSFLVGGLQPGRSYHFTLKGCSRTLLGSSCGPWSPGVTIRTPEPPPPPPPPRTPEIKVTGFTGTTIELAFSVKTRLFGPGDMFKLYRDGQFYRDVPPKTAPGGYAGTFVDTVESFVKHQYQVCFENAPYRKCSVTVAETARGVDLVTRVPGEIYVQPTPPIARTAPSGPGCRYTQAGC